MAEQADGPYLPIDCSLHDRLEELATQRRSVVLQFEDERGIQVTSVESIRTWFVRDGCEFLATASGMMIRLDRLLAVDGVRYRGSAKAVPDTENSA